MSIDGEYGPSTWQWVAEQVERHESSGGAEGNMLMDCNGGAPEHPAWYHNLVADPNVAIQDGPEPFAATVRRVSGDERATWWERSVAAYPPYEEYQEKTEREIPVFVAEPR